MSNQALRFGLLAFGSLPNHWKNRFLTGAALFWRTLVFSLLIAPVSFGGPASTATQTLLDANPGMRAMMQGEELLALYGVPFATDSDPQTSTDDFVTAFLTQNGDALGVVNPIFVFENKINIRNDKFTVYTYSQSITDGGDTLPAHATLVKIPVLLGPTEKIGYIGIRLFQPPQSPLPADVLTDLDAVSVVSQSTEYGHLTTFTTPEKVISKAEDAALHRVWRFEGFDDDEAYRFFVDTNTGEIVGVNDLVYHDGPPPCSSIGAQGTVTGWATPGTAADTATNPPVQVNVGGAYVRIMDDVVPACPSDDGTLQVDPPPLTDETGAYVVSGIAAPLRVTTRLVGEWVTVENDVGAELVGCAEYPTCPPNDPVDFEFNPPPHDANATSQVNCFLVTEATHDWFKALQPNFTDIDENLLCVIDYLNPCGQVGGFIPMPAPHLVFSQPGTAGSETCASGAFSTVISHEYGHYIVYQLIPLKSPFDPALLVFYEAVADTVAVLMWDDSCTGKNLRLDGECFRDVEFDTEFDNCDSIPVWCNGCDLHCRGLAFSGAFWDLKKEIGLSAASELFSDFLLMSKGDLTTAFLEVLVADDDDADLTNGTPLGTPIIDSFVGLHGWPNPFDDGVVNVVWDGPPGAPVLGVDYVVDTSVFPPDVILKTTEVDVGGEQTAVTRWRLGREGLPLSPPDIGSIYADWTGLPHNIEVIVGSPADPNLACRRLDQIDIDAQSTSNYSSVQLTLAGNLEVGAQCYAATAGPDDGNGGRLSGTIAGSMPGLGNDVKAIGVGAVAPATLDVAFEIGQLLLNTIPAGSVVRAERIDGVILATGDVLGTIDLVGDDTDTGFVIVIGDLLGTVKGAGLLPQVAVVGEHHGQVLGEGNDAALQLVDIVGTGLSTGDILMDGDIGADPNVTVVTISGDMDGDIVADADGDAFGAILGAVSVSGIFNGNICGTNLSPAGPLPGHIDVTFGPRGRICGVGQVCPVATILSTDPPDGTIDARQPHPPNDNSLGARQGIGSANTYSGGPEPITITLGESGADDLACWSLCETGIEAVEVGDPLNPNAIASVEEITTGVYEILLERPISAAHWTTISFLGDDSFVSFASLPVDVNGDGQSTPGDLISWVDCCLRKICSPAFGMTYSCDIDHSVEVNRIDQNRIYDLWNGASTYIPWLDAMLAENSCPQGGGEAASGGGGSQSASQESGELAATVVYILTTPWPEGMTGEQVQVDVGYLLDWVTTNTSSAERQVLAVQLQDPNLTFADATVEELVPSIVQSLVE